MADRQSRICGRTVGRTGSTALMDAVQGFDDIAVPNKTIACPDNELVHPRRVRLTYESLCDPAFRRVELDAYTGRPIKIEDPRPLTGFRSQDQPDNGLIATYRAGFGPDWRWGPRCATIVGNRGKPSGKSRINKFEASYRYR